MVESPSQRYTHCSYRENALPACSDLHLRARQDIVEPKIWATAILRCSRERLRSDEGWVFKLMVRSVTMTPNANGCDLLANFDFEGNEDTGRFSYVRKHHNQIVIKPNGSTAYLQGLVLDDTPLSQMHASSEPPCSLSLQIGAFPEDIVFDSILSPNALQPVDIGTTRRSLVKIVISKALDRVGIEQERPDRVGDQLILSRALLSAASSEDSGTVDACDRHAQDHIDWRAIDRLLAYTEENFVELARAAHLDPATDFVRSDLRFVDFGKSDLTGFNFEGSNLIGANLGQAAVENANLRGIRGTPPKQTVGRPDNWTSLRRWISATKAAGNRKVWRESSV